MCSVKHGGVQEVQEVQFEDLGIVGSIMLKYILEK
jgi:hypothetical protein